jgi:hypothetical protein
MFNSTYNELPAARFQSLMQCNNLQVMLKEAGLSFMTKIVKNKKRGKEFIVMLVENP